MEDENASRALPRIAIAQINPRVGDFLYNKKLIIKYLEIAKNNSKIDLLVFPELCICGYDPRDLALRSDFCESSYNVVQDLVYISNNYDFGFIVGGLKIENGKRYNCAFFICNGEILLEYKKRELPNYGVFDEVRIYEPSDDDFRIISFRGINFGILICEDLWNEDNYAALCKSLCKSFDSNSDNVFYSEILDNLPENNRSINNSFCMVIAINASPFWIGKNRERVNVIRRQIKKYKVPLLYVNMVGGQDEIIYDGGSMYFDASSRLRFSADFFKEGFYILCRNNFDNKNFDLSSDNKNDDENNGYSLIRRKLRDSECGDIYNALILSLRDYVEKNNFSSVLLGYSSGIDSTLVALIAIDSLGIENVDLLCMPSIYTSDETFEDSRCFFELIGITEENQKEISINNIYNSFVKEFDSFQVESISDEYKNTDIALQNLQSRIRGNILMYFANKNNSLLLTTGNKSEIAVGYCTLYGDTNGAFNPIKDLYKTQVYEIARWRNKNFTEFSTLKKINVIPENILNKNPSAELKSNQRDSDSIPEYSILDKILELYIDNRKSIKEISEMGFDYEVVKKVANMVRISQFKRSQSALGTKVSKMSFGLDFRYPITNGFI